MEKILFFRRALLCTLALMLGVSFASATDYYFKVNGSGVGDGSSWDNALEGDELHKMLGTDNNSCKFQSGDNIYLAAGTYYIGSTPGGRTFLGDNKNNISFFGGYPDGITGTATEITYPTAAETILSGDLNKDGKADAGDCMFFNLQHTSVNFNGITFAHGYIGTENSPSDKGAATPGFYISAGGKNIKFNYCKFEDMVNALTNSYDFNASGGAVVKMWRGNIYFRNCIFDGNKSHDRGGVFRFQDNTDQNMYIDKCTFTNNGVEEKFGGIFQWNGNAGCKVVVNNSTFANNYVGGDGAGVIFSAGSQTWVMNSTFVDNYCSVKSKEIVYRTEKYDQYVINSIMVNDKDKANDGIDIVMNNHSLISSGYLIYGTSTGNVQNGIGDQKGIYKADVYENDTLADNGGFGRTIIPAKTIKGASVDELKAFKTKYASVIPEDFDVTVDQNGKSRAEGPTPGAVVYVSSTGIGNVLANKIGARTSKIYDVNGIRVDKGRKTVPGVYIIDGRKIVVK